MSTERPKIILQEWVKAHNQLPGQCAVENISYPSQGSHSLALVEENHFWFTSRRELILNQLKKVLRPGACGLDVGCGSGFNADWLSNKGFPTLGIDAHKISRSKSNQGLGFLQGDIFSLEPMPEFDFVTLLDVIEHIKEDRHFFNHVLKFVKPGGIILLTTPAFMSLWSEIDAISGHYRRYTKASMASLVSNQGVKLEKQFYYYGFILPLYVLSRLMTRLRKPEQVSSSEFLPSKVVNSVFELILKAERWMTPFGGSPVGSSLITVVRRV